jgi:hypothetical protein
MTPEQIEEMRAVLLRELDGHSYAGAKYWADRICAVLAMPSPERDAGTAREGIEDLLIGEGLPEADWVNVRITEAYRRGLANNDLEVHLSHCNFGENAGVCKYGEPDCPALAESWAWLGKALQDRSTPPPATREPVAALGIGGNALMVPVGMMEAASNATSNLTTGQWVILRDGLEAALGWLMSNLPLASINDDRYQGPEWSLGWNLGVDAVRRMFLAPAPAVDPAVEAVKEVLARRYQHNIHHLDAWEVAPEIIAVVDASRKGQQ